MATTLNFVIDADGVQVPTLSEFLTFLTEKFQEIYGTDIDLDSESPDAQWLNILSQVYSDMSDLVFQVHTSVDPDQAVGVVLDQRLSINGIQRQAGTYTYVPITVVASKALTLYGLDQSTEDVFTVSDKSGNQYELSETKNISAAGSYSYSFRAANPGRIIPSLNTITTIVTVTLGVTSVNNPSAYTTLGIDEETDASAKIRRQKSTAIQSKGFNEKLYAALMNISGVTSCNPHENYTSLVDEYGTPPHCIWPIIDGSATDSDIANAIYSNRTCGCDMKGNESYTIHQDDGTDFTVNWDVVVEEDLFAKFTVSSLDGTTDVNISEILSTLPSSFIPGVSAEVNINDLVTAIRVIDGNCLVTGAGFSTSVDGTYTDTLETSSIKNKFVLATGNIYILPALLSPKTISVPRTNTQQFTPYGGSQTGWTYAITTNVSGGTISSTGLYTAGSTAGTDIITATDSDSNTATATVTVI